MILEAVKAKGWLGQWGRGEGCLLEMEMTSGSLSQAVCGPGTWHTDHPAAPREHWLGSLLIQDSKPGSVTCYLYDIRRVA